MKYRHCLLPLLILFLFSCSNNRKTTPPTNVTPKALEEKSTSYELVSKRYSSADLVESLYAELLTQNKELKHFEEQLDSLKSNKADSLASFETFREKNQNYYAAAEQHINQIKDSTLKRRMKEMLAASLQRFTESIKPQETLLKNIEQNEITISDLHNMIKVIYSLPLMEKYQKDNRPSFYSLNNYMQEQEKLIIIGRGLVK